MLYYGYVALRALKHVTEFTNSNSILQTTNTAIIFIVAYVCQIVNEQFNSIYICLSNEIF